MEGRGGLTMASISLQDLRRRLYVKAKADKDWRFERPPGLRLEAVEYGVDL
jgi:hypothetical protein